MPRPKLTLYDKRFGLEALMFSSLTTLINKINHYVTELRVFMPRRKGTTVAISLKTETTDIYEIIMVFVL